MNTKRYFNWLMVSVLAITGLSVTSCKDEPDKYEVSGGKPVVYYVRSPYLSTRDSLMTGAYMGNTICLVGDNLRSIVKLFFNDQEAILNSSFITDHTLICDVPNNLPEVPTDKIYMITGGNDTVSYDFSVLIPQPTVNSISNEYAVVGETATIYGDYLLDYDTDHLQITMPGGIAVTEFTEITKTSVTFVIPQGATEAGNIYVTSKYGTGKSKFYFRDNRGMILDWDGVNGLAQANGWRTAAGKKVDDGTGVDGAFVRFSGSLAADGWSTSEDDWCFNYWPDGSDAAPAVSNMQGCAELLSKYKITQLALKFEFRIPADMPWQSTALQLMFTKADVTGTNSYYWDAAQPRSIWNPYSGTGSYDTGGKWQTASIPLSTFNKTHTGDLCANSFSADYLGGLTFYFMGGVAGVAGTLQFDFDNVRISPIE